KPPGEDSADSGLRQVPLPLLRLRLFSIRRFRSDHPGHRASFPEDLWLCGGGGRRLCFDLCHPLGRVASGGAGAIRMKVLLRIRPIEPPSRTIQLRELLSWIAFYLIGAGLMMGLVFLVTGAFPR